MELRHEMMSVQLPLDPFPLNPGHKLMSMQCQGKLRIVACAESDFYILLARHGVITIYAMRLFAWLRR